MSDRFASNCHDESPGAENDILLTFAIPTFNRLECLRLLVDSLSEQMARINTQCPRVELLICDNASSDGTADYLQSLAGREGYRVIRHPSNLGADANVIHCFRQARGRYVWICGDDDLPLPGLLDLVVDCLEREHPALLYLPAQWHAGDLSAFLSHRPEPGVFAPVDPMSLALTANAYITFISSWVVNRETYAQCAATPDPARHAGTSLPHLEWHLSLLVSKRKLMTSDCRWLIARSGNTGGYSLFDVFITNYTRIVDEKLQAHASLRQFFRNFMLRSHLPGLVWGLRQQVVGEFGQLDHGKLRATIHASWPEDWFFGAQVSLIGRLPRLLARGMFVVSWLASRLWLAYFGIFRKAGNGE